MKSAAMHDGIRMTSSFLLPFRASFCLPESFFCRAFSCGPFYGGLGQRMRSDFGNLIAAHLSGGVRVMNMVIYMIGTLLVVAGLAYGANRLGIGHVWIA